jgi:sporulation protein YlmC with PRC-barrel domain/predicted RNase H-like HicB family nuclease
LRNNRGYHLDSPTPSGNNKKGVCAMKKQNKYFYPAVFTYEDGYEIAVTFPDLPGCTTSGMDEPEALEMAKEALGGHLWCLENDGDDKMFTNQFLDKNTYTITGHYFGKVKNIILNLETGKVSKISVVTTTDKEKIHEEKGLLERILDPFELPNETPNYKNKDLVNIGYDKIIAIGDIFIVNLI